MPTIANLRPQRAIAALPLVLAVAPASAHLGHVGEAAGHSHWIGLAALAGAAAIAAWIAKQKGDAEAAEAEEAENAEEAAA